jgi:hypothetical protein
MIMRHAWILIVPLLVVGCVGQLPAAAQPPPPVVTAAVSPTKSVETRYDVSGYREAANPAIRHESHAVYRRTRVPITASEDLETVPRAAYAPPSYAPLPASAELGAELALQRTITADLRAMQASIAETEQRVQAQYATLVRQSAEALKLRDQLEAERRRVHAANTATAATPVEPPGGTAGSAAPVKW